MTDMEIRARLQGVRCFLLDMDGTFYLGDKLIEGSLEFLAALERTGRTARFLTNNSSKSAQVYAKKLERMGVDEKYRDVMTSGHAAAHYCLEKFPGGKCYLLGNPMLAEELTGMGLELVDEDPDYVLVDGYIISRSADDWTSTLTINRGTSAGIQVGMCAITAYGEVVGLVVEAGSNYSVIKTVLDSSLEISATIASTGYSGIVSGGYTRNHGDMLWMEYLDSTAIIRNRDQVVTAGSTVYPRNLILGYVVDAGFDDTGVEKYAVLEPAADIESLEQIFILTAYDAQ